MLQSRQWCGDKYLTLFRIHGFWCQRLTDLSRDQELLAGPDLILGRLETDSDSARSNCDNSRRILGCRGR